MPAKAGTQASFNWDIPKNLGKAVLRRKTRVFKVRLERRIKLLVAWAPALAVVT